MFIKWLEPREDRQRKNGENNKTNMKCIKFYFGVDNKLDLISAFSQGRQGNVALMMTKYPRIKRTDADN